FRALPFAPAKSDRRAAAHPGRVRNGHDSPLARRTGGNAGLAHRKRGQMRTGRDAVVLLDGRMVYRRQRSNGLGFWNSYARARAERSVPRAVLGAWSGQFYAA